MYYEIAEVKKYVSVNKKDGTERTKFQINLLKDSKFREPKEIALVDVAEIKEVASSLDVNNFNELEVKYNDVTEELTSVKQELQEAKATIESLTSEVEELKEEKVQLQQDLLTEKEKYESLVERTNSKLEEANVNVIEAKDKIEQLQKEHKEEIGFKDSEIAELNYKLNNEKDYSKALLVARSDLLNRNIIKRLANIEPESSKYVAELKKLPENVEANVVNEEND